MKKILSSTFIMLLFLSGCSASAASNEVTTVNADYDEEGATYINLDEEITIDGNGASLSDDTLTISKVGTYIISGSAEVKIVVDCEAKGDVKLVCRDASITYASGPAILISQASCTYIILDEGTTNTITTTGEDEEEGSSAIKSHDDLIVCGSGTLNLSSDGDGIHANDSLIVQDTNLNITAGDDGIDVNDLITLNDSTINVTTAEGASESSSSDMMGGGMPQGDMGDFDPGTQEGTQPLSNEDGTMDPPNGEMPTDGTAPSGGMPTDGNFDPSSNSDMTPPDMNQDSPTTDDSTSTDATVTEEDYDTDSDDSEAKSKGIKCDGDIVVTDCTITIDSADDAFHTNASFTTTNSTLTIKASDDGIHADDTLTINSGNIDIQMSYEGLEAKYVIINDGIINIVSSDDGINATDPEFTGNTMMEADESKLTINGGTITVDAEGDGIDMNGDGEMNGGTLTIYGPTSGADGAIDSQGTFNVNGGTLIAGGSSGMAEKPSESSTQNCIMIDASGTTEIKDSEGNTLVTYASSKTYENLVYSSSELVTGETYTIYIDGEESTTVTIESTITDASSAQGMNMGGNMQMPNMNQDTTTDQAA